MTLTLLKLILSVVLTVHLMSPCNVFAEQQTTPTSTSTTKPTVPFKRSTNRFLSHLVKKYGSRGTISFEGFEHLMQNLGIGDLSLPHPIDSHRLAGYQMPEVNYNDETITFETGTPDIAAAATTTTTTTAAAPAHAADNDYNLIKIINKIDNDKQDDVFRTMHDPNHRHPRHRDQARLSQKTCLSPIALIQMYAPDQLNGEHRSNPIYRSSVAPENDDHHQHKHHHHQHDSADYHDTDFGISNIQITPQNLLAMCPALLVQIEQGSCNDGIAASAAAAVSASEPEPFHHPTPRKEIKEITSTAWIYAVVSITIISLCGLVGIAMVPLTKFSAYHDILRFMISIAIGTLVGDALMHLIPHALVPHSHAKPHSNEARHGGHDHGSETDAVWLLGCAFMTALLMYFIESMLPLLSGNAAGGHGHSHGPPISNKVQAEAIRTSDECHQQQNSTSTCGSCEDLDSDMEMSKKSTEESVIVKDKQVRPFAQLTPVAFMVVIGDVLHNLTDGMAIGAAFGVDPVTGMATALAVLCHELPHELGDFALLLQTGVSLRRAFVFNFISSVVSFIGTVIGLLIVNANNELVRWIYTGTAGTFLYIAFADLVPELGRAEQTIKMTLIQALGILLGGIIMLLIGLYEDNLRMLFE